MEISKKNMSRPVDWRKYFLVFIITGALFATAMFLSNYFNSKKISQLEDIQNKISVDILSSETQFSLLEELSCKDISNTFLSQELNNLADKIDYTEKSIGTGNAEVLRLKRYYSLLEIKDYLLMKKISERCKFPSAFILYFYTTKDNCPECTKEGYALDALRDKYPKLRVYSFDYNLDLSAISALKDIYKVGNALPALVINGNAYNGFKGVEDIEKLIPNIKSLVETPEEKTPTKTGTE